MEDVATTTKRTGQISKLAYNVVQRAKLYEFDNEDLAVSKTTTYEMTPAVNQMYLREEKS